MGGRIPTASADAAPGSHSGGGNLSSRDTGRRKPTCPCNWLKALDEAARTLPSATDWLGQYGPFMLARYPSLHPQPVPGDAHSQIMCESGERTAARLFAEWETRIVKSVVAAPCLERLSAEQRRQLAALLLETMVALEMRPVLARRSQFKKQLSREATVRLTALSRKLQKARQSIEELMAYAQDSGKGNTLDASRHSARLLLGQPYGFAAGKALRALDIKGLPDAREHVELASESFPPEDKDPEAFGMVQLYWFFRHGCSLSGNESEVRVARLRNAFWTEHGVRTVIYRARYDKVESKGCEAVHVAVNRFKPLKGYKSNENPA
jgi:hypothetical protein